uniref:Uncharacterized protein n=1 Tax=Hildenbrandia rubra TaxID=31481 RepID=A0A0A7A7B7_9FLOR|nr:hypothetical protein Hild.prot.mt.32 [Hildenbrandia rubra]AHB62142.1 hypothetical protein Hild.prot.mt.32 [Hildenbrandia rubra]
MALPVKGTGSFKKDNPLIILTNNMCLEDHDKCKYTKNNESAIKTMSARVYEIRLGGSIVRADNYSKWQELIYKATRFNKESPKKRRKRLQKEENSYKWSIGHKECWLHIFVLTIHQDYM